MIRRIKSYKRYRIGDVVEITRESSVSHQLEGATINRKYPFVGRIDTLFRYDVPRHLWIFTATRRWYGAIINGYGFVIDKEIKRNNIVKLYHD